MTQYHRSASTCLDLAESCRLILPQLETQTSASQEVYKILSTTLEALSRELRIVLARAERKQQRRVFRMKLEGGNQQ